jgi:hypothetical protein
MSTTNTNSHAYVLDVSPIPGGFLGFLQDRQYVDQISRTVEGVYVEPRTSLGHILDLFERAGASVHSFRAAGTKAKWQESNAQRGFRVLTNPRAAAWLPTVPAA